MLEAGEATEEDMRASMAVVAAFMGVSSAGALEPEPGTVPGMLTCNELGDLRELLDLMDQGHYESADRLLKVLTRPNLFGLMRCRVLPPGKGDSAEEVTIYPEIVTDAGLRVEVRVVRVSYPGNVVDFVAVVRILGKGQRV